MRFGMKLKTLRNILAVAMGLMIAAGYMVFTGHETGIGKRVIFALVMGVGLPISMCRCPQRVSDVVSLVISGLLLVAVIVYEGRRGSFPILGIFAWAVSLFGLLFAFWRVASKLPETGEETEAGSAEKPGD